MRNSPLRMALKLSRVPSSAVAFLTVFVPTYAHSGDAGIGLAASAPMVTISMCTFILNDLRDLERDRINHPDRPLPAGLMSSQLAAVIYSIAFVTSLVLVRSLTPESLHYTYLCIFILAINYNVIVDFLPNAKNIYVSFTSTLTVVLAGQVSNSPVRPLFLLAVFLFILGREILMDVRDTKGDGPTLAKQVSPRSATIIAFALQGLSVIIASYAAINILEISATAFIFISLLVIICEWHKEASRRILLQLMKLQMLASLAFLI